MESDDGSLRADSSPSSYSLLRAEDSRDTERRPDAQSTTVSPPDPSSSLAAAEASTARVGDPAVTSPYVPSTAFAATQRQTARKGTETPTRGDAEVPSPQTSSGTSAQPLRSKNDSGGGEDLASKGTASPDSIPSPNTTHRLAERKKTRQFDPAPPDSSPDAGSEVPTRAIVQSNVNAHISASENIVAQPRTANGPRFSHVTIPSSSRSAAHTSPVAPPNKGDNQEHHAPTSEQAALPSGAPRPPPPPTTGAPGPNLPTTNAHPTAANDSRGKPPATNGAEHSQAQYPTLPAFPAPSHLLPLPFAGGPRGLAYNTPPPPPPQPSSSFASPPQVSNRRQSGGPSHASGIRVDASTNGTSHPPAMPPTSGGPDTPVTFGNDSNASAPPAPDDPPPSRPTPAQEREAEEPRPTPPRSVRSAESEPSVADAPSAADQALHTPTVKPHTPTPPPPASLPTATPPPPAPPPPDGPKLSLADDASDTHTRHETVPNGYPPNSHPSRPCHPPQDPKSPKSPHPRAPKPNGHPPLSTEQPAPGPSASTSSAPARGAGYPPLPGHGDDLDNVSRRPWLVRVCQMIVCCLCFK
ncbi:hypothetical protein GY45DRAFT_1372041 [Cubamyces sp. BRFM 1775]|nr:hypothetical protein GY45DRAFT_1372041 [Cubamyces sp. BRFM 1775]